MRFLTAACRRFYKVNVRSFFTLGYVIIEANDGAFLLQKPRLRVRLKVIVIASKQDYILRNPLLPCKKKKKNFHILALQKTPLKHHPLFWCLSCFKLPVNYLNCDMQAFLCEDCNEILKSLIGVINI